MRGTCFFGWMLFTMTILATAAPVKSAARPEGGKFTAVRLAKAPVLDGKIEPGEWDGALTTSGVMAAFDYTLLTAKTEMSVGFDDTKLHFMFRCWRSAGESKLSKSVRSNDGYSFGDPSVEVWVSPPKAIPETYQSVINTYPAVLDLHMIPSRGYTAQGWTGHWEIGVSESPDEYIVEASIPIADFGVKTIKDGDVWQLLLCRAALGAWPRSQGSWSITTGFGEIPQHPPVTMRDDAVVTQLRGVETLFTGNYRMPLKLTGPRKGPAKVVVETRFHKAPVPGDASDVAQTQTVALAAGATQTVELVGAVPVEWARKVTINKQPMEVPAGNLTITVSVEGGDTLLRQTFPYVATGWTPSRPTRPENKPAPPELGVFAKYGPESNTLILRADILDLPQRQQVRGGQVRLLDPNDADKELSRHPLANFIESYSDIHFKLEGIEVPVQDNGAQDAAWAEIKRIKEENRDRAKQRKAMSERKPKAGETPVDPNNDPNLKPLPVPTAPPRTLPRKLVVEVGVTDESGAVIRTARQEIEVLRQTFSWQNNTLGMSDKVIPPWTPIEVKGNEFSVWNRKLTVDGLGMLTGVDNGGVKQMRSMRLVAIKDGKPVEIKTTAPKVEKRTEAAVTFTGEGTGAGLKLSAHNTLEMDGYILTDLTIAPEVAEASVDKLYLEVVLPESEATHFAATAGGWSAVHDETPAHWSSQTTASGVLIGDFVPYIWLTNSDRGFLWVADNDKGWITEDKKELPTQEIIRKDGTVTLRIHFIEIPTKLNGPTSLRYAHQTFPARPLPGGWRSWVCSGNKVAGAPSSRHTYFFPDFIGTDWVINWPYYGSPFPHSWERSKRYFDRFENRPEARPTVGAIAHSIGFYRDYEGRNFPEYSVDWGEEPGALGNNDVTQSRGPIDFRVFNYSEWVRRSGMRMIYIDENYLSYDRNFLTGGAYYRADGRLQPGYTYLGLRDYYKRLTYALHDAGAAKPNLWMHISSGSAYHAWWADIFMEGENVAPTDEQYDYIEVLPAARMRAIGSAKTAGGAMLMMCQALRHKTAFSEKHIHQFVGWVMAHDILPEQVTFFAPIAEAARFYRDDVQFMGYWHAEVPVKTTAPESLASIHRTDGRAIVWIVNQARQDRAIDLAIDWKKLGLDRARTSAVNAETGAAIALTDAGLTVDVLKRDFVAVLLIQRPQGTADASFLADFEKGPQAEFAMGAAEFSGADVLIDGEHGKALSAEAGVSLLPRLNLRNDKGLCEFRARLTGKAGSILEIAAPSVKKDEPALPPGLAIDVKPAKGQQPGTLSMRIMAKDGESIQTSAPDAGWHQFKLSWESGKAMLSVDGKPLDGALAIQTLNIGQSTGEESMRSSEFAFGSRRGAIDAIDDVRCTR